MIKAEIPFKHPAIDAFLEDTAEALEIAGADDASVRLHCGELWVNFDREADTTEIAVRSALSDLDSIGVKAAAVEPADFEVYRQVNASLAAG